MAEEEWVCFWSVGRGGRGWWSRGEGRMRTRADALVHRLRCELCSGACVCVGRGGGNA